MHTLTQDFDPEDFTIYSEENMKRLKQRAENIKYQIETIAEYPDTLERLNMQLNEVNNLIANLLNS